MHWVRRISIAVIMLLIWSGLMMIMAYNFDALMLGGNLIYNPVTVFLMIWQIKKACQIWLLTTCLGLLGIVSILIGNIGIESRCMMQKIIPGIKIPKAAGQGQYGTAHFLSSKKFDSVWSCAEVQIDKRVSELMEAGRKEAESICT